MSSIFTKIPKPILTTFGTLILSACALDHAVIPAKPTEFLTSTGTDTTERISRLPFKHSWRDPQVTVTDYKHIVVRPVTTKYLKPHSELSGGEKAAFEKNAEALAKHFTRQLNIAFSDPICIFYKTSATTRPRTLILEVALTDAHFPSENKPHIPMCAFEARVTDATTGKLVSTASDRRGPDLHLSGEQTHITDNEEICSIWSRQLMEASNKEIFANVRRKLITVD